MKRNYAIAFALSCLITGANALEAQDLGSLWKASAPAAKPKTTPKVDSAKASKPKADTTKPVVPSKAKDPVADTLVKKASGGEVVAAPKKETAPAPAADANANANAVLIASLTKRVDSLKAAQAAAQQATALKLTGLGNFRFSGDIRVRYEGQFQGGGFVSRHRERTRARFVVGGAVSEDLTGGFGLATGALDDVQSPNQTESGFFARKTIAFDRFFLSWKPSKVKGFNVTAGKFPYTWDRTQLTFGNDINPEGASVGYTLATKHEPRSAGVTAFVLPYLEVAGGDDSYAAGAQFATKWQLPVKTALRASVASISFHGADQIALAAVAGTIKPGAPIANRMRTDSTGKILGYASMFHYEDAIVGLDNTSFAKWPVTAQVDVVRNARAAKGSNIGYWSDLRAGRLAQPKDLQLAWSFFRIERDAIIGAFDEQDLRAATNVLGHKWATTYQWRANATIGAGVWYGRLLDPTITGKLAAPSFVSSCTSATLAGCRDPWLTRLQLDVSYKF